MYYFYVLQNKQGLYYGSTNDLKRRLKEHNRNQSQALQWKLIYYEAYLSEIDARNRESKIKHHGQAKCWLKERIKNSLRPS